MKSILLFGLFALAASVPTQPEASASSQQQHGTGTVSRTVPDATVDSAIEVAAPGAVRQFGSRDSPAAVACSNSCEERWKREQGDSTSSTEKLINNWNKACGAHDHLMNCLSRCAASSAKTSLTKKVGKDQWICHDSTFKQNARCLLDSYKATPECAQSSKCGRYDNNDGSLKDIIKQYCLQMKCTRDCQGPTIVRKCGQAAMNDDNGIVKKTLEFIKYRVVEQAGLPNHYPARECDPLLRL